MSAAPLLLTFGRTSVELRGNAVITTLPGGDSVLASPQDEDAYRATAERLGYGGDTLRMCQEHEALHSALCAWLGLFQSPTMRGVVVGEGPTDLTNYEEDAVLSVQKFANAAGIDLLSLFARHSRR